MWRFSEESLFCEAVIPFALGKILLHNEQYVEKLLLQSKHKKGKTERK